MGNLVDLNGNSIDSSERDCEIGISILGSMVDCKIKREERFYSLKLHFGTMTYERRIELSKFNEESCKKGWVEIITQAFANHQIGADARGLAAK